MTELCLICRKRMYIGKSYRITSDYNNYLIIGYVHRKCLDEKLPKAKKEAV